MVSVSQLVLDDIDAKLNAVRKVVNDCITPLLGTISVFWTNNQKDSEQLTDNYAVIATSEGALVKYTLDREKWKQECVLHVEIQVSKDNVKTGERIARSLRILFSRSFSFNDTVVTATHPSDYANDRGHLFAFTVEFNFIVGVPL